MDALVKVVVMAGVVVFVALVILIPLRLVYGRMKYGSWTGSFLKGQIERTIGEIQLKGGAGWSQKLEIHTMQTPDSGERFVAVVLIAKAATAASMQPLRMTVGQAQELADFLTQAAQSSSP